MIRHINQVSFQPFGLVLSEKEQELQAIQEQSLTLTPQICRVFQAEQDTRITYEQGMTRLSLSWDNEQYADYYLDKGVLVKAGVYFSLSALQEHSTVRVSNTILPVKTEKVQGERQFAVNPGLKVEGLYTFFYQEKEPGFFFAGEAHPMLELTYVDQGSLHSVADGVDQLLRQGEAILYGPGQWHMQYAQMGVAPRYVTLSFAVMGDGLSGLFNRKFPLPEKASKVLRQMLWELEAGSPYGEDMIISLLNVLLILLQREAEGSQGRPRAGYCATVENEIIARAQKYITAHVRDKLSVPVVAEGAQVSASYLTALFQKHLNISPGEYIRRIKLQESKQLIREGKLNLTQIAQLLQYSTIHHFSRQFKGKFGITPSEYAKSLR